MLIIQFLLIRNVLVENNELNVLYALLNLYAIIQGTYFKIFVKFKIFKNRIELKFWPSLVLKELKFEKIYIKGYTLSLFVDGRIVGKIKISKKNDLNMIKAFLENNNVLLDEDLKK